MPDPVAIPRWYAGEAFRSTLEADWACTLDSLGIRWKYEPAGIRLPSGDSYLPDSWPPGIGTFIEVKGEGVPGRHKPRELAAVLDSSRGEWDDFGGFVVLIGLPASWRPDGQGHYGSRLNWQPAGNYGSVVLGHCRKCGAWSWVPLRRLLACRQCQRPFGPGDHLSGRDEITFRHVNRVSWTVVH